MPQLFDLAILLLGHQPKVIVTQVHKLCVSKDVRSVINFVENCRQPQWSSVGDRTPTRSTRQLFKHEKKCVCVCVHAPLHTHAHTCTFSAHPMLCFRHHHGRLINYPYNTPLPHVEIVREPFFVRIRSKCFTSIPRNELKHQGSQQESLGLKHLPIWGHFRTACISTRGSFERCL